MVDGPLDHYHDVIRTNIDGVFFAARVAAAHWRRQKESDTKLENYSHGSFVATASMSGHIVNIPQMQAAYNASKSAVRHLCTWLLLHLQSFYITSNGLLTISQADLSPLNGPVSLAPTPSPRATCLRKSRVSPRRKSTSSGNPRLRWAVRDTRLSSLVAISTLRLMLRRLRLARISPLTAATICHKGQLCSIGLCTFFFDELVWSDVGLL